MYTPEWCIALPRFFKDRSLVRFQAHFDGKHLLPDEPVELREGTPLRVTVEELSTADVDGPLNLSDWFDEIESQTGLVEGPEDWSAELDHYLYGTPKASRSDDG